MSSPLIRITLGLPPEYDQPYSLATSDVLMDRFTANWERVAPKRYKLLSKFDS